MRAFGSDDLLRICLPLEVRGLDAKHLAIVYVTLPPKV
jgi:hypothetical protein